MLPSKSLAIGEAVRSTTAEVWAHKLRSLLTLVGVIFGTAAVVFLVSIIEAVKVMVWDGIKGLGFDGVMFVSGRPPEDLTEQKKMILSRGLTVRDLPVVRGGSESFHAVAAVRLLDRPVTGNGLTRRARIYGVTPSYARVHDREVSRGRWFDDTDEAEARKIAVLGAELADILFGSIDPIGRSIRIGDTLFRIIGVEARLGNRMANSGWTRREMEGVLIPLASLRAYLEGGERVSLISIKTPEKENLEAVKAELERLVRRSHHGISDFEVENIADEMLRAEKEVDVMLRNWTIVLAAIAGISLLVGGVGIYSVMKISLAERLYEIGLRKAIGASDGAILAQFLVESTMLSVVGAALGCALATGLAMALSGFFEAGLPVAPLGLMLGVGFALFVGIFAGFFPSLAASRMTPVEALQG